MSSGEALKQALEQACEEDELPTWRVEFEDLMGKLFAMLCDRTQGDPFDRCDDLAGQMNALFEEVLGVPELEEDDRLMKEMDETD